MRPGPLTVVLSLFLAGAPGAVRASAPPSIVVAGRPSAAIVLPETPSPTEQFAAAELRRYVKAIAGADLPIGPREAMRVRIHIGRTPRALAAAKQHRLGSRDLDAHLVAAEGGDVTLVGRCDRGTLYAVYELLERWGCLWPAPGVDSIPRRADLAFAGPSGVVEPAFRYRVIRFAIVPAKTDWHRQCLDWAVKQRINFQSRGAPLTDDAIKRGGFRGVNSTHHTAGLMTKELFDKHPDWFAEIQGRRQWRKWSQMCNTSDGAAAYFAEHINRFFDSRPDVRVFAMTQSDGTAFCECAKCRALDTGEEWLNGKPVITERWLNFVNLVAGHVAAKHPDRELYTLAYHQTMRPPDPKQIKVAPNVVMEVVHSRPKYVCFLHRLADARCPNNVRFTQALREWVRITPAGVYVYDYYPHSTFLQMPYVAYRKAVADIRHMHRLGVVGMEAQTSISVLGTQLPNIYAIAHAMRRPDLDVDRLMDRFFDALYGTAAPHVKAFCECLETAREACTAHSTDGVMPYFTADVAAQAGPLIERALAAAEPASRGRVQALHDHFVKGREHRAALDAFARYEQTGEVEALRAAVRRIEAIRDLAAAARKDPVRDQFGIHWVGELRGRKGVVRRHLARWRKLLLSVDARVPDRPGVKVGVYAVGYGAVSIIDALNRVEGVNAFPLPSLTPERLSACQVAIVPNAGRSVRHVNAHREDLRRWTAEGGGLLLLHDAVGYRKHEPVFPEIGKGADHVRVRAVTVAAAHPAAPGLAAGARFRHAYSDHVVVSPARGACTVVRDPSGAAVVVCGEHGKGKVVLNGMLTGYGVGRVGVAGQDMAPEGGELAVLTGAVRWLTP